MKAAEVTDEVIAAIQSGDYNMIRLNLANGDMVGHTGIFQSVLVAMETVDICVKRIREAVDKAGGVLVISADHGNAEIMVNSETGEPYTAHSLSPVPLILVADQFKGCNLQDGGALKDIAPTMLSILSLPIPDEMEGNNLLKRITDEH